MGNSHFCILKEKEKQKEVMIEDLLKYKHYSLCDISEYKNLLNIPNFGYLLNSGESPEIKNLFLLFWGLLEDKENVKIVFKKSGPTQTISYYFDIYKRKDNNECQSMLIVLNKMDGGTAINDKYIDLWRDSIIELPEGMGTLEIDDYYLNIDTKNHVPSNNFIELETYHIVNNFLSGLLKEDFVIDTNI